MDQFKELLEKQMQKAKAAAATPSKPAPPQAERKAPAVAAGSATVGAGEGKPPRERPLTPTKANVNRVTINLFETDHRALAVIKEMLGAAGHDFTNRSDSIKVALRIAAKAKREELARLYEQVKAEDRRFKTSD